MRFTVIAVVCVGVAALLVGLTWLSLRQHARYANNIGFLVTAYVPMVALLATWVRPVRTYLRARQPTALRSGRVPQLVKNLQPRSDELLKLRSLLEPGLRHAATSVAVVGMPGVGKSQLAAAYANNCIAKGYELVAWIDAESSLVSGLAQLGSVLGVPSHPSDTEDARAEGACTALEKHSGRRLVVFDNATDPHRLGKYLPAKSDVEVIITSTNRQFGELSHVKLIDVGLFTDTQGVAYLRQATRIADDDAACQVGKQLGWLPLALAQAAPLIRDQAFGYERYLQLLHNALAAQALPEWPEHRRGVVVGTAIAIDALAKQDPSGLTPRIFEVLCLLSPEGIDIGLIEHCEVVAVLGTDPSTLRLAVSRLAAASLLAYGSADTAEIATILVVHRLTARITRESRPDSQHDAAAVGTIALKAATDQLPEAAVSLRRRELNSLVGHIQSLREGAPAVTLELLALMVWSGTRLTAVGDLERAVPILERAVVDYEMVSGFDHTDTMAGRRELGEAYRRAGNIDKAIATFEQTRTDRERILGPSHADTLRSQQDLAGTYRNKGRFGDAIALYEHTCADMGRILGHDHLDAIRSRHDLAYAYRSDHRYDEAIPLFEHTIADYERVVGPHHRDAMRASDNLATTYRDAGCYDKAITLYRKTIDLRADALGTHHQDTLESRNNLATAYRLAGDYETAMTLHAQALAERTEELGPYHLDTLSSRHDLADAHVGAGRIREAVRLYEQTLAGYEHVLNSDHLWIVKIRRSLREASLKLGD